MRISAVSQLITSTDACGKLTAQQRACGVMAAAQMLLLLPILVAVMLPSAMIAANAFAEPALRDRLAAAPMNTAGALAGVSIWLLMFGIPAYRALRRLGWSRSIELDRHSATVHDRTLFARSTYNLPLTEFDGVSHHVRTNLSGMRHELVLVHADPRKSLLVMMADAISQDETDEFARRYMLAQLPPGVMFRAKFTPSLNFQWPNLAPYAKPQRA
ncbi:MAG: hypothetical protein KJ622_07285 [Alphaproteobacteria bacterium]|nr:hypothetical protein [Alphaproteobacteria bacterium]